MSTRKQIQITKLYYFQNHFIPKLSYNSQSFFSKQANVILSATFQGDDFIKISSVRFRSPMVTCVFSFNQCSCPCPFPRHLHHWYQHPLCCFPRLPPPLLLSCPCYFLTLLFLSWFEETISSLNHCQILASATSWLNESLR